jgi:hypothetical protein
VIAEGIPGTAMPASPAASAAELDALVAYVLTLTPKENSLSSPIRSLMTKVGMTPAASSRAAPGVALRDMKGMRTTSDDLRGKVPLQEIVWVKTATVVS